MNFTKEQTAQNPRLQAILHALPKSEAYEQSLAKQKAALRGKFEAAETSALSSSSQANPKPSTPNRSNNLEQ